MLFDDVRALSLFDGVTDDQLRRLVEASTVVPFKPGETLWLSGTPADYWWVLVEGTIDLVRAVGREETVLTRFTAPSRWAGGFRAWDDGAVYLATGRATSVGRMLRVPAAELGELLKTWPLAAHLVDHLFNTVRNIEASARQREALVTLGTLAAGLAHEINNPASAATRAVDALEGSLDTMLTSLQHLAVGAISAEQFGALDALRREIQPLSGVQDALAVADREDELSRWLAGQGIARGWVIAPVLAAAGADVAWCDRAAAALPGPALAPGLEWVASALSTASLLSEVRESTRRVSNLVSAVKSYTQMDRAGLQRIAVTDGIESTLTMLGHKLKDGIAVQRDYGVLPEIDAYASELNQVWTNLVDNAIDAMDGVGTLRLATRVDGDAIVVVVGDCGQGMPAEVAARAFEAFYTTKDVGKGTGLGLDIARRIVVDHHGGSITIESQPGDTVVQVRLPVRQPHA